uniref:Uncharacterized protein n=1 Tax=Triticum urartu TaxID=4572 RepID=A0A8R7REQ3_TRIUA
YSSPVLSSHDGRWPSSRIATPLCGSYLHAGTPPLTTPLRPSIPACNPSSPLPRGPGSRRATPRHRSPAANGESKLLAKISEDPCYIPVTFYPIKQQSSRWWFSSTLLTSMSGAPCSNLGLVPRDMNVSAKYAHEC